MNVCLKEIKQLLRVVKNIISRQNGKTILSSTAMAARKLLYIAGHGSKIPIFFAFRRRLMRTAFTSNFVFGRNC
jgi:hypothetical protein